MIHLISGQPKASLQSKEITVSAFAFKGENEKIYQPRRALINIVVGKELARN